ASLPPGPRVIRVAVVDDQTLMRQGIRSLLELTSDIRVVSEAADGEEGLRTILESRPEGVLLDVRMPKGSGSDVLCQLRRAGCDVPAILLPTFSEDSVALEGVRAGARGFLLKDVSFEQLTEAIRTVAAGGTLVRPAVTERALRGIEERPPEFD